jgi:hypothetical protein
MGDHDFSQGAGAGAAHQELSRRLRVLWAIITAPVPATEQGDEVLLNGLTTCNSRPRRIRRRCRYGKRT